MCPHPGRHRARYLVALALTGTLVGAALPSLTVAASAPQLVRDIKAGGSSQPMELTVVGDTLFFSADGWGGRELWKSDGTAAGTVRVKNIRPGWKGSNPNGLRAVGDLLYFMANDGTHGYEVWRSDGTEAGTWMLKDLSPGAEDSYPSGFSDIYGTLYFFRGWPKNELWSSDGTRAGTHRVKVLDPDGLHNSPDRVFPFDGRAWFIGSFDNDVNVQLWVSDGTSEGTEVWTGDPLIWGPPVQVGSSYFFKGTTSSTGQELYVSDDGTVAAIELVEDIWPGPDSGRPLDLVAAGGWLYFTAESPGFSRQLWRSDGTPEGTRRMTELQDVTVPELTRFRSGVVFLNYGEEGLLWKSHGTRRSTRHVLTDLDGIGYMTAVGPTLVFTGTIVDLGFASAAPPHDNELWRTDGTSAGTYQVMDIHPTGSSSPRDIVRVGEAVFFTAVDGVHGRELWSYVP